MNSLADLDPNPKVNLINAEVLRSTLKIFEYSNVGNNVLVAICDLILLYTEPLLRRISISEL